MHGKPVQRFEMPVIFAQGIGSKNIIHKNSLLKFELFTYYLIDVKKAVKERVKKQ
jgi:hypothetical protein